MKINKRTIRAEEEAIRNEVAALESQKQKEFHTYCAEKLKDPDTFAALTWSLPIGLHHFYLGAWQRALPELVFDVATAKSASAPNALVAHAKNPRECSRNTGVAGVPERPRMRIASEHEHAERSRFR